METVLGRERFELISEWTFQQCPQSADNSVTFFAHHLASEGYSVIIIGEIGLTCAWQPIG